VVVKLVPNELAINFYHKLVAISVHYPLEEPIVPLALYLFGLLILNLSLLRRHSLHIHAFGEYFLIGDVVLQTLVGLSCLHHLLLDDHLLFRWQFSKCSGI
jgi:hypothetical protein